MYNIIKEHFKILIIIFYYYSMILHIDLNMIQQMLSIVKVYYLFKELDLASGQLYT